MENTLAQNLTRIWIVTACLDTQVQKYKKYYILLEKQVTFLGKNKKVSNYKIIIKIYLQFQLIEKKLIKKWRSTVKKFKKNKNCTFRWKYRALLQEN